MQPFVGSAVAGSWMPGRERLLSVVEVVGAYVWGRHPAVRPLARTEAPPVDADESARLGHVAYPDPGPVRPRPADKPTTVAHYQALADQVANERRLSHLADHAGVQGCHDRLPHETWPPAASTPELGGLRRG
jgi:hypothetical protein